jgi:hypothetical protein
MKQELPTVAARPGGLRTDAAAPRVILTAGRFDPLHREPRMARTVSSLPFPSTSNRLRGGVAALCGLLLVGGCQTATTTALPDPNFAGPVVNVPVRPQPPAAQKPPVAAPVRPAVAPGMAAIPAAWVPKTPSRDWQWIVIHHSATHVGAAAKFDREHRAKGWDELGYHFVIGNGTQSADGAVEIGSRWPVQKWGAHTKTPDNRFNEFGIGICLVGNFDLERPTQKQMQSLAKLVAYLMDKYNIPADRVVGHRDCKSTDCPGANLNIAAVRKLAIQMNPRYAAAPKPPGSTGTTGTAGTAGGSAELLQSSTR